jgi:hypothetical protein
MDIILGEEKEEEVFFDTKYLRYSRFKNGYLEKWIRNKYDLKTDVHSSFSRNEIWSLIFIFLMYIRTIISLSNNDENKELLMYLGRQWRYIEANYVHVEVMFLLWTINIIAFNLYVIHRPDNHYKWLELFAFLNGIIPYKRIGKTIFKIINFFYKFFANYMKNREFLMGYSWVENYESVRIQEYFKVKCFQIL